MTTFTYDLATDVGKIRLLIPDKAPDAFTVFTDQEIQAFLDLEGDIRRAAAQALETMASNEAYVTKAVRNMDLTTDGPKVAAELRARASALRAQALELEALIDLSGDAWDIAEMPLDPFAAREIIDNAILKGQF